jgi:hypothetical protein
MVLSADVAAPVGFEGLLFENASVEAAAAAELEASINFFDF